MRLSRGTILLNHFLRSGTSDFGCEIPMTPAFANQGTKTTKTQIPSYVVNWSGLLYQWKGVGRLALERLRGSHNEQSVGLRTSQCVCWRHVGVVVLPLNSQAIVTLVMCCWMYSMHSSTCSRSSWTSDSSSSQRELKNCSAILELLENDVLLGIIRHYWLYWLYWLFVGCCSTFGSTGSLLAAVAARAANPRAPRPARGQQLLVL